MPKTLDYSKNEFGLGITMAGAISAGAYTSGVLDVLLACLLNQSEETDPDALKVILKAMSGTSAGGACTALSIPALIEGKNDDPDARAFFEVLYAAWVKEIDLLGGREIGLVDLSDLAEGRVRSLLNSGAIEEAVGRLLADVHWDGGQSQYIAADLDLFITCTTLNGITYNVPFNAIAGDAGHKMADHAFVAHFSVQGLGTHALGSDWLELWKDVGVPLTLAAPGPIDFDEKTALPFDKRWSLLREMGVVTGAFPVGLSAQDILVTAGHFGVVDPDRNDCAFGGAWPMDVAPSSVPVPLHMTDDACSIGYAFVGVDGGVCNNEPFEYARFCLREKDETHSEKLKDNPRKPDEATRAVIMIDPFPEGPETKLPSVPADDGRLLAKVFGRLIASVQTQVRFKPAELVTATQTDTRSRFLIAPSSSDFRGDLDGADALASGLLGGFGGFLDERFRQYDFDLGRHNAHSFLSKHFTLQTPHKHYQDIGGRRPDPAQNEVLILPPRGNIGEMKAPEWPRIENGKFERIVDEGQKRAVEVGGKIVKEEGFSGPLGFALRAAWTLSLKKRLKKFIKNAIGAALTERDQLQAFADASESEREVLRAMMSLGEREALLLEDISAEVDENLTAQVEKILENMVRVTPQPMYSVRKSGSGKARYKLRLL